MSKKKVADVATNLLRILEKYFYDMTNKNMYEKEIRRKLVL